MNKINFYKQLKKICGCLYFFVITTINYLLDFVLDQDQIVKETSNLGHSEIKELLRESLIQKAGENFLITNNKYFKHYSIFKYKNHRIKSLIWQLKFNGNRKIAGVLAKFIVEKIGEIIQENQDVKKFILIPIPIHKKRRAERGYNQCEWLCEEVLKIKKDVSDLLNQPYPISDIGLLYFPKVLVRQKYTVKQSWVSKNERMKNIHNVFKLSAGRKWQNFMEKNDLNSTNSAFLIIDDVYTTGSTMKEASKILSKLEFKIISLTVAR